MSFETAKKVIDLCENKDFTLILAIKQVGSTITAILGCMEPLTALFLGVCFLNETLDGEQLVGIFVILSAGGVYYYIRE